MNHSFLYLREIFDIGRVTMQLRFERNQKDKMMMGIGFFLAFIFWLLPLLGIHWSGRHLDGLPENSYITMGQASTPSPANLERAYKENVDTLSSFKVAVALDDSIEQFPALKEGVSQILTDLKLTPVPKEQALIIMTFLPANENEGRRLFMKDGPGLETAGNALHVQASLFGFYFSQTLSSYWKYQQLIESNVANEDNTVFIMGQSSNVTGLFQKIIGVLPMAFIVFVLWALHLIRNTTMYGLSLDTERKTGLLAIFSSFLHPLPVLIYGRTWPTLLISCTIISLTILIYGLVLQLSNFLTLAVFAISVSSLFCSIVWLHLQWNVLLAFLINHYMGRTFARLLSSPFIVLFFSSVRVAIMAAISLSGAGMFLIFSNIFNSPWVALGLCLIVSAFIFALSVLVALICHWRVSNNPRAYQAC